MGLSNCSENALCVDQPEGFRCICKAGFTGDGIRCQRKNIIIQPFLVDECAMG